MSVLHIFREVIYENIRKSAVTQSFLETAVKTRLELQNFCWHVNMEDEKFQGSTPKQ